MSSNFEIYVVSGDEQSSESLVLEESSKKDFIGKTESMDSEKKKTGGSDTSAASDKQKYPPFPYGKKLSKLEEEEQTELEPQIESESSESVIEEISGNVIEPSEPKFEDEVEMYVYQLSSEDVEKTEEQVPEISREDIEEIYGKDVIDEEEVAKHEVVTKPKISLTDKEFVKGLQAKQKFEFVKEGEDNVTKQKPAHKIGFKEPDEEMSKETTKHQKGKHKIGFKIDDE